MSIIGKIKINLKKRLHDFIWKMADLHDLEDQVKTTSYFVTKTIEPSQIPAAEGPMRDLQECDVQLLRIFHAVCEKQGWTYWLDYGTLLGCVRHGGFIPWDDDMDVSVPRDDFEKMVAELPELVKPYGIDVEERPGYPMSRLGFSYKHYSTGVWLDIFPVDFRKREKDLVEGRESLSSEMDAYRDFYLQNRNSLTKEQLTEARDRMIRNEENGKYQLAFLAPEFACGYNYQFDYEQIYPLKSYTFEGYTFCGPNKLEEFLTLEYGKHYMSLPSRGVESHASENGVLSGWAAKSHTDMKEVLKELRNIADQLEE